MEVTATDGSCRLEVDADWDTVPPPPGAMLVAVEPPTGRFRCNVVVTRDSLGPAEEPLADAARRQLRDLAAGLTDYVPVQVTVGATALEIRGLHVASGMGLALCQWACRDNGGLLVLSISLASRDVPALAGTVDAIAASWRVSR